MKRFVFSVILVILGSCVFAQTKLIGAVTCADDSKPVPYVSIGIVNTPDGTVSNVDGQFILSLNHKITDNDTLVFSSIGYDSKGFLIKELKENIKKWTT